MALEFQNSYFDIQLDPIFKRTLRREQLTRVGEAETNLAQYGYAEYWLDRPAQPGEFYTLQQGVRTLVGNRVEQVDTWAEWEASAKRSALSEQINFNRLAVNKQQIDVQADPGLIGLMEETNAAARLREDALIATADNALDTFDSTLDPTAVGALAAATSLVIQQEQIIKRPELSAQDITDVQASIDGNRAVVANGDDSAAVVAVPSAARRFVGAVAEDYGILIAEREFENPWWWLEFELQTERQLNIAEYFVVVYADDNTTYLTTPQLIEVEPGRYRADRAAVNLPRNTKDGFWFTLAHQHIDYPQFDRVRISPDQDAVRYRARWAGQGQLANGAQRSGTAFNPTGQTVQYAQGDVLRIANTSQFDTGSLIQVNGNEHTVDTVHSSIDLIVSPNVNANYVGHEILLWS